jgi:conjugal transfer ATP-binding protein TraC
MKHDLVRQLAAGFSDAFTASSAYEAQRQGRGDFVDLNEVSSRMASWLPYRSYSPVEQVFVNRDSIGFVLECVPQTGADADTVDRLKGLFARLPTHGSLQFHLFASPRIAPQLREYANLRRLDPDSDARSRERGGRPARNVNVFRSLARRRYAHLNRGAHTPLIAGSGFLLRNFRLLVSATVPGHVLDTSAMEQLVDIREGVRSTLESARFTNRVLNAEQLIDFVGELLNPRKLRSREKPEVTYDELKSLEDQCVDRDTTGDWSQPSRVHLQTLGVDCDDSVDLRFLSVQRPPRKFALWGMGSLAGDVFQDTLQIPCPFLVTMGLVMPDQKTMGTAAAAEKIHADRNARSEFASLAPSMVEKNADWARALKATNAGGKLVWMYHQVMLLAPAGEGQRAESAVRDVWRARGFELVADSYIHKMALLQALPMTLGVPFVSDLQRFKRLELRTSGNAIHLAPLLAEARGTGTPTMLPIGRRGQVTTLDFYDNVEGGKNVSIVGAVGSGKSTLLQEIAWSYASKGAKVRVFELGRSFERLTERVTGQFVRFNAGVRVCVNPFSMVSEQRQITDGGTSELVGGIDDDVAMLQPLLAKMASPNVPLDPAIYASLAIIIKEEYARVGRAMTVTDVMQRYRAGRLYPDRDVDQRYLDMSDMLAPFSKGGVYEQYFEGAATLDFGNDFIVFELQELSANPHLRSVVQMILLYKITQEMLEERERQKLFIMDEAKEALAGNGPDDKILAEFLEKLYLRVRKYNGSAITATQDVAHYFDSSYGASIWNESDFIILGKQSDNSIEAIKRGEAIRLDENLRRLLGSIGSGSGHFKEWYIHSGLYRGVVRCLLDPGTLLLFSNRAEDNTPIDAHRAKGLSVTEAIDAVLAERGVHEAP